MLLHLSHFTGRCVAKAQKVSLIPVSKYFFDTMNLIGLFQKSGMIRELSVHVFYGTAVTKDFIAMLAFILN